MGEALFWLYLIFGLMYGIYDWLAGTKDDYQKAIEEDNIDSPMFAIHWIFMIIAWPFIMLIKFIREL